MKASDKHQSKIDRLFLLPEGENRQGEGGLRTKGYFKTRGNIENSDLGFEPESFSSLFLDISRDNNPLITVITVVFNGEKHLEETILSVINQTYDNVEYIIIDGGSSDRTVDIIKKYNELIDYWVSEPDLGISDAFNKGIRLARGDYINFQGDGDGFYDSRVLADLFVSQEPQDSLICGKVQRIDKAGNPLFISKPISRFKKVSLLFRMSLPHQSLFTPKRFFEEFGLFDIYNSFSMDYELLLCAYKNFPNVLFFDRIVANWRDDGVGNGREKEVLAEYHRIKLKHNVAPRIILRFINLWILFKFQLKSFIL